MILTDKDMSERNVSGKAMPQANLQLCMFHVPRNCRREVSVEKLGISVGEKIRALEILQDIVYSKSDEQYKLHYNKLCNDCSNAVISYYNWHNIRKEWVDGLKDGVNLGNRTNNRIESINDKVKSVFKHHSTLPEFAENFLIALKSLRTERDLKTVGMFQKKAVAPYPKESPEYKYRELVTPYAWSFILKQLMQMSEVTIEEHAHPSKRNLQLKKHCTTEAWKAIEMVYGEKRRNLIYICETCTLDAGTKEASVMCSSCLECQNLSCARLKLFPKAKHWFFNKCKR